MERLTCGAFPLPGSRTRTPTHPPTHAPTHTRTLAYNHQMSELYDTRASLHLNFNFSDGTPCRILRVRAGKSTALTVTATVTARVSHSGESAAEDELIRTDGGSVVMPAAGWRRACDVAFVVVSVPHGLHLKLTTAAGSPTVETPPCSDGLDNDGDGLADWPVDPGCAVARLIIFDTRARY